ncbi:blue copper protein-like [Cornus florida]|uniref:blue copper protein-like n=1 Tax=Cornus florida TaxID=4283 RepID=UPI0028A2BED8|nr:blue copper protein-like [Cornus florida]
MATTHIIIVAILALSISVSAKEFIVGDDAGWDVGPDYQDWAEGKEFVVGDTLVFKYPVGDHNVFKVNGTAFKACMKPPPSEALTTGNDVITLATPGKKWYICGVGMHCAYGEQKLAITVQPNNLAPAPSFTFPIGVSAKEFIVGDDAGWDVGPDYQDWAEGKEFVVGDTLVFKYPVGDHNVFKVNGTAFKACMKPPPSEALTTGNDVITLATPGKKWYICGVGMHCAYGEQKLAITVQPNNLAPAPSFTFPIGGAISSPSPMPAPMPAVWYPARKIAAIKN